MAYTKYSLTPANNTAAPPDGAPEGMLPSAVNDTMRDMMAQIRDCGDGIRDGTYTMTAPKITGGTITGAAFTGNTFTSPVISGGTINNATIGATTASTGKFTTLEATGVATFSAGTVSAPAITTTGDTNTGIFFPAADTIAFTEGGVESMRINSSGRVLIGSSSSVGNSNANNLELTNSAGSGVCGLTLNVNSGSANTGNIYWRSNASNNAIQIVGDPISNYFAVATAGSERMRIDSSGNVGIGTSSPATRLDVSGLITGRNGVRVTGALASSVATSTVFLEQDTSASSRILATGADAGTSPTFSTLLLNNAGGVFGATTLFETGLSVRSLGIGGTTPSSSGRGITFPATQSASSDANTLDDYEEGTWTPSVGGNATYYSQDGRYTKIGNIVYIQGQIQINLLGTGSTSTLFGLPFTSASGTSEGGFNVTYFATMAVNVIQPVFGVNGSSTNCTVYSRTTAGVTSSAVNVFGNSARMFFYGHYQV